MCVRVCNNYPMHDAITFLQKQHADMMLRYLREKMSKARDKLNEQQAEEVNVSAYYCCMQKKNLNKIHIDYSVESTIDKLIGHFHTSY